MAQKITYRKAVVSDYQELHRFHVDVYYADEPLSIIWDISNFTKNYQTTKLLDMAIEDGLSYVAVDTGKIIGMALGVKYTKKHFTLDSNVARLLFKAKGPKTYVENVVRIESLGVHRNYRKKGIATKLTRLLQIESWLQGYQWLITETASNFSRKLFDRLDFVQYDVQNIEDIMVGGMRAEVRIPDEVNKTYSNHGKKLVAVANMELIEDILTNL